MKKSVLIFLLAAGFFFSIFLSNCFSPKQSYDLVIKNAQIIDGSGKAGFTGDVGIKDSRIIKLGNVATNNAKKIIDAKGLTLTPGFIDVHTHYPYTATSSGFTSSFPSWAFEGGKEEFLKRLKDRKTYNRIKNYIIEARDFLISSSMEKLS